MPRSRRLLLPALVVLSVGGALVAPATSAALAVTPAPGVVFKTDAAPTFGPAAVVSAHFLGAEPQTTLERPTAASVKGALDENRVFVDWPVSSRTQTGTLHRSLDGGKTFRLLFDPLCAPRSRPMCTTGGGGDTENEVNPVTGQVYFADQEVLVQEAFATSNDHGDTFPVSQSFPVTSVATGVDRQWVAAVSPGIASVAGQTIAAFYTYHVPIVGEYIVGVTDKGVPLLQPVPQVTNVSQSGQVRVDNTNGPGRGWIYQPYRTSGYKVATAFAGDYATPAGWKVNQVGKVATEPDIFPWLSLDDHGNAYATWIHNGRMYYAVSLIDSKANNPKLGGRPATEWSAEVDITPPNLGAVIFPEIVAGTPGRAAIAFNGTSDFDTEGKKKTDDAPPNARWNTYVSVLTNALGQGGPVQVRTGKVSHRIVHTGNICTSGTTCAATMPEKDRSLLDLIDIGLDADGAVGVVYTDNNFALATPADPAAPRKGPFVQFAKQVGGTSISSTKPLNLPVATGSAIADPSGDANFLNRAGTDQLTSLDLKGVSLSTEGTDLVARVPLVTAAAATMRKDFDTYNATLSNLPPAERLHYIVRFTTNDEKVVKGRAGDVFHLSMEQTFAGDGGRRFFGGRIDDNDAIGNPASPGALSGVAYNTDAGVPVKGRVEGSTIVLRTPLKSFGLAKGSRIIGLSAFAAAGPAESGQQFFTNIERTVDATAPLDLTLAATGTRAPTANRPQAPATPAGGSLPTTGGLGAPLAALLLLVVGLAVRRRRAA
ncbi:MAG: hypothetical protein JWN77_2508 [Frankiales bacterium]|jgi:hypothetical protein|nr:hypothetical protein [Frankiales bacterium]